MKYLFYLSIISIVLFPSMLNLPGLPAIRFEDILFLIVFVDIILNKLWNTGKYKSDSFSNIFLYLIYFSLFSVIMQELVFHKRLVFNDFMIFPMLVKYWIALMLGRRIFISDQLFKQGMYVLLMVTCLSAFIGILQYHNIFGINYFLTPKYDVSSIILDLLQKGSIYRRTVGTIGDPRPFAFVLVCGMGIAFVFILHETEKFRLLVFISALCLLSVALIYTLTRSVMLCLVISSLLTAGGYLSKVKSFNKVFQFVVISVFLLIVILDYINLKSFERRVLTTKTKSYRMSIHARVRDLRTPFKKAVASPQYILFGKGPSKSHIRTSAHNDFGWFFERFGLIGLVLYLSIFYFGLKYAIKLFHRANSREAAIFYLFCFFILIHWFIFANAEDMFKKIQLMPLILVILGGISKPC